MRIGTVVPVLHSVQLFSMRSLTEIQVFCQLGFREGLAPRARRREQARRSIRWRFNKVAETLAHSPAGPVAWIWSAKFFALTLLMSKFQRLALGIEILLFSNVGKRHDSAQPWHQRCSINERLPATACGTFQSIAAESRTAGRKAESRRTKFKTEVLARGVLADDDAGGGSRRTRPTAEPTTRPSGGSRPTRPGGGGASRIVDDEAKWRNRGARPGGEVVADEGRRKQTAEIC